MERFYCPQIVRSAGENVITGLAAVFYDGSEKTEMPLFSGVVERIDRHAFDRTLRENKDIICSVGHDFNKTLGCTPDDLRLWTDDTGLHYECKLDDTFDCQETLKKITRNRMKGSSFGSEGATRKYTKDGNKGAALITDAGNLFDVGPCVRPAYSGTIVSLRSKDDTDRIAKEYARWLALEETAAFLARMKNR